MPPLDNLLVNLNGALQPAEQARISLLDHGLLYGAGVFETLRGYGGRPFRAAAHLARLRTGAALFGIDAPWSDGELEAAICQTLIANGLPDGVARLSVTRGAGPPSPGAAMESPPTYFVVARRPAATPDEGLAAIVASFRVYSGSPLAQTKSLGFGLSYLARLEAQRRGADEAILLNESGVAVESSVANLFAVIDGALRTAPVALGCLPGITRQVVLELAENRGIAAAEKPFALAELMQAEEAFITNSALGVAPLRSIEGSPIGADKPGTITRFLAACYGRLVEAELGVDAR
jgi:branched-chain amino acid aminotransferase